MNCKIEGDCIVIAAEDGDEASALKDFFHKNSNNSRNLVLITTAGTSERIGWRYSKEVVVCEDKKSVDSDKLFSFVVSFAG